MAINKFFINIKYVNIIVYKAFMVKYLKFIKEKFKISNKILFEQVEKIIYINIKYLKAMRHSLTLAQI